MHETKVNTKNDDVTSSAAKNVDFRPEDCAGSIKTPFGRHFINRGDAHDFGQMKTLQLTSLLRLMQIESGAHFRLLSESAQASLMWLALQQAEELEDLVDILVDDVKGGQQ